MEFLIGTAPLHSPNFYEILRREMAVDGVEWDSLSPYSNLATLPAYRRAAAIEARRAFIGMAHLHREPDATAAPKPSLWRRLLRALA